MLAEGEEARLPGPRHGPPAPFSDATAIAIDEEVRQLIDASYKEAESILSGCRNEIEVIAKALMEYEVISGEDLDALIKISKIEADCR